MINLFINFCFVVKSRAISVCWKTFVYILLSAPSQGHHHGDGPPGEVLLPWIRRRSRPLSSRTVLHAKLKRMSPRVAPRCCLQVFALGLPVKCHPAKVTFRWLPFEMIYTFPKVSDGAVSRRDVGQTAIIAGESPLNWRRYVKKSSNGKQFEISQPRVFSRAEI